MKMDYRQVSTFCQNRYHAEISYILGTLGGSVAPGIYDSILIALLADWTTTMQAHGFNPNTNSYD